MGIGRPWDATSVLKRTSHGAYPRIISNLGGLADNETGQVAINMIRFMNHYARSLQDKLNIVAFFQREAYVVPSIQRGGMGPARIELVQEAACFKDSGTGRILTKELLRMMCDFFPVGYSNTLGYAHPNTGDTMASVMIGGLRTVQNGDFEVFPGDILQFYWPFEKDDFTPDGRRKPYLEIWDGDVPCNVDPSYVDARGVTKWDVPTDARTRQTYYNLQYSAKPGNTKLVALIKPYFRDDVNPRLYDWLRVFAVALSSARPHEQLDIKISKQSV